PRSRKTSRLAWAEAKPTAAGLPEGQAQAGLPEGQAQAGPQEGQAHLAGICGGIGLVMKS
ncbi:MAG: hypothetical protein KF808_05935, partial [Cryobacterium sp.]|nr:hypothetical protein [Cryobacterium sp.]